MAERLFERCHILVVEDEYLLAADLGHALAAAGAEVVGPVGSIADARALLDGGARLDGAVLDINLHDDPVFPLAEMLRGRGVPFVFATGYDRTGVPERFADAPHLAKPVEGAAVMAALAALIRPRAAIR